MKSCFLAAITTASLLLALSEAGVTSPITVTLDTLTAAFSSLR
jgi:hypothetical protein